MQLPPGIRAVAFDAVGTLMAPDPPAPRAYEVVGRRFGSKLGKETIRARFAEAYLRQERLDAGAFQWRTSEARERDRWRSIVAESLPDATDQAGLFDALWEHFSQPSHWKVFPDVAPAWSRLISRGATIVIASNFDSRLQLLVQAMPPLPAAARLFVSSAVGWRKPAAGFYEHIERELNLAPRELLMIGDDFENDVAPAEARGWHAARIDRGGGPARDRAS